MNRIAPKITQDELNIQLDYSEKIKALYDIMLDHKPKAYIDTYGCQQNFADSEFIMGMLTDMGIELTTDENEADIAIFNTCAIREHAEMRVLGNIGKLKQTKKEKAHLVIAVCGCMAQQEHMKEKILKSYPYVNLLFGTHALYKFPELLYKQLKSHKRVFDTSGDEIGMIFEGVHIKRDRDIRANLPIMYGCNNFCSYCIVPHVRGRERSREPEVILDEAKALVAEGYKLITLLGQNVNSYGKGCDFNVSFAELVKRIDEIEGDFKFDFMTSHPRDCSFELIDVLSECKHYCGHLHLPVQSGNNRVLKEMNRHYTRERYLELVNYAKEKIPCVDLTTDIIVGFPGETYEEFLDTISLVKEVRYGSMFTFIYSARKGTPAASMPDPFSKAEKTKWFMELLKVQEEIQKS